MHKPSFRNDPARYLRAGQSRGILFLAGRNAAGNKKSAAPGKKLRRPPSPKPTLAAVLQQVARKMTPFYRKVALNEQYARSWSHAVVKLDLDKLERLLRRASPAVGRNFPGTNGIGYFISFPFPKPIETYASGTTIPPGAAHLDFPHEAHRAVAAAVFPLYRALALNRSFALALARAIEHEDPEAATALVRSKITSRSLRSVAIDGLGLALAFRFSFSKHTYRNLLFQDVPEEE